VPVWASFNWNATVPANTTLRFQVAGSNNAGGPFNFVGPDNTAATFYTTSGVGTLLQFKGMRYLKYKAFFTTTDSAVTPTITDVTVCFANLAPTAAGVTVSGRVLTPDGRGLRNARVLITDSHGVSRSVTTSSFGFYQFDDVAAGDSYVIGVSSKLYRFSSQLIQVSDTLTNVDFTGQE